MIPAADWIQALGEICKQTSQAAAAQRMGISTASISLLLRGAYTADTSRMEAKVRAFLVAETRACPVLGEIPVTRCYEEQAAPYFPSPIRSSLYRACQNCEFGVSREAVPSKGQDRHLPPAFDQSSRRRRPTSGDIQPPVKPGSKPNSQAGGERQPHAGMPTSVCGPAPRSKDVPAKGPHETAGAQLLDSHDPSIGSEDHDDSPHPFRQRRVAFAGGPPG